MKRLIAIALFVFGLAAAVPLVAQDQNNEQQKDWLVGLIEGQLSSPERQIRISNIDGVLSENASINEITISDKQGVWLRVNKAALNWNQGALLGGKLDIRSLTADSIEYLRNPIPSDQVDLPAPEAGGLEIPQLPVAIVLQQLSVPKVTFGEQVFGLGSEISVAGGFTLEGGNLDAKLDIQRLDGPGGTLAAAVKYLRENQNLDLDVTLTEPPNGIIANLFNIEGKPEMALAVKGSGPVSDLRTEASLDAGGKRALSGVATIRQVAEGFDVNADLHGPIAELMAPEYRPFFGAEIALTAQALVRAEGGFDISAFSLTGQQIQLTGRAQTTPDNFLRLLDVNAAIRDPAGGPVKLPLPGQTTVEQAQLAISYGLDAGDAWTSTLSVAGLDTGDFQAKTLSLNASGVAANLDQPDQRRLTFNGDGTLSGIVTADAGAQAALGDSVGFGIAGLWSAGQPVELAELKLVGKALTLSLAGQIADAVFDGRIALQTSSIAPFSALAERDLSGAVSLTATGTISPLIGGFNLVLDGTADNLSLGDPSIDPVLAGQVTLGGRVARTEQGLEAENFTLGNDRIALKANGTFASGAADFGFSFDLADLGLVTPQASGRLAVVGTAKGQDGPIALNLDASLPSGRLAGRALTEGALKFAGSLADGTLSGDVTGAAFVDGFRVDLASTITSNAEGNRLSGLNFVAGGTTVTGNLLQTPEGLLDGALALIEASGAADLKIDLAIVEGKQSAEIAGTVRALKAAGVAIGAADLSATIADLFGVPRIEGSLTGSAIAASGVTIDTLAAKADLSGDTTSFDAQAHLATGTSLDLAGSLSPLDAGYRLALDRASLTQGQLSARLAQPAALTINGDVVGLDTVVFDVGGGRITASGSAGTALDIALVVENLPLSIANAVQPGLGLAGTINGRARIGGSGADPNAQFDIRGDGIAAAAVQGLGITPFSLVAQGSFADNKVQLASLTAQGAGGLSLAAQGTVPLAGPGLSITANGSAPLALANRFVADRGGQASGVLRLDAQVTGSLAAPRFAGTLSTAGAQYIDAETSLRLNDIAANASLNGETVTINSLSAALATGGSISGSGTVSLTGNFPAQLALALNSARYADGNMLVATLSGNLAVTGSLLQNPLVSGNILVERADITIPSRIGGGDGLIDVKHVDPPPAVAATLKRIMVQGRDVGPGPRARPSVVQLDITVNAPHQIFIRGRGLDAEVGGSVRLTGPLTNIQPVGGFTLSRGRLNILGQRVEFESGEVTLIGDLDPFVNLVARTQGNDITVFVTVSGRISDISVDFTSNPPLPQDEVLSRLIFKRSMGELSPLQLAKLAGAAAELAGGGGSSLTDSLRNAAGLADLDVVTDENGNLAVQAGQYIQDNIYLGVQAGANGQTRVTVNLDITDDLKAKASLGADGNTDIGVFYEHDY